MELCDNSLADNIPHDADCHKPTDPYRIAENDTETQECELKTIIEQHGQDKALEYLATKQDRSVKDLNSALISACQRGFMFLIQSLLRQGANINCRNKDGNTPLMISVSQGFIAIARFLIKKNANINSVNACGDTALMLCLRPAGAVNMVKLFLQQREIDLAHQNQDGYTALMKAVETLDIDVIKLLLDKIKKPVKQKINCKNETAEQIADKLDLGSIFRLLSTNKDRDVIVKAVETNDTDLLQVLIDCYSCERRSTHEIVLTELFLFHDKNKTPFEQKHENLLQHIMNIGVDMANETPYFNPVSIAVRLGCANVLQLLLEHGAQPYVKRSMYYEQSPLVEAAEGGRVDLLELLVKYGAKVNEASSYYKPSPLKCALKNGHLKCAEYLIQHGAEVNLETDLKLAISTQKLEIVKFLCKTFRCKESLKIISNMMVPAARVGNLEVIDALLKAGANVNQYVLGKTPLMEAKNGEVVNFLVKRGAAVNRRRHGSWKLHSPLTHILAQNYLDTISKEDIVEALLKNGAVVNGKSNSGRTPLLMVASMKSHGKILQMLLNHGADVNVKDKDGSSILLLAAQNNCSENVTTILQNKQYLRNLVNMSNYDRVTPLMAAERKGNHQMVVELIEAGADVNLKDDDGRSA